MGELYEVEYFANAKLINSSTQKEHFLEKIFFSMIALLLLLLSPSFLLLTRAGNETQRLVFKEKPRR